MLPNSTTLSGSQQEKGLWHEHAHVDDHGPYDGHGRGPRPRFHLSLPYLSGDIKAEKRQAALQPVAAKRGAERQADAARRRKQITESIKELELHGKRRKQSLETRIAQAGLSWSRNKYIAVSLASAVFLAA
jgi:hypothetical protein